MRVRHGHNRARRGTLGEQVCFRGETAMSNIMQAAVVETLEKPHVLQEVPRASSRCDMPNIALLTRDGARFEFPCAQSDYILDAAAAANLYLPAICHEGTCGACHAHVGQGHFALGQIGDGALPDAPSGGVLLCRCRPEGDLVIDVPYPQADVHHQQIPRREATIVSLKPVDSSAVVLTIALTPDPALGTAADFTPGQYMEVWIPGTTICRAYSLANLPNWDGQLEFVIRLHEVTADLQDLLIYQLKGIGQYRTRLGALGRPDREADSIVLFDLFATLTNVNFDHNRFVALIAEAAKVRDRLRASYEAACHAAGKKTPEVLNGPASFVPADTLPGLLAQASAHGVRAGIDRVGADVIGLRGLLLFGLKGVGA